MDSDIHKEYTGVGNELILKNIKKVVDMGKPLNIRTPVIPGFNATEENIDRTAAFILNDLENKPIQIQLLKYRPLGEKKAKTLGLPMEMKAMEIEDHDAFERQIKVFAKRMQDKGIPAIAGSRKKKTINETSKGEEA